MTPKVADNNFTDPVSPGEILTEEFLKPFNLSIPQAAAHMHIPRDRLAKIVSHNRIITVDTAMRLGKLFGTTAEFWLNLQSSYDLRVQRRQPHPDIEAIEPIRATA